MIIEKPCVPIWWGPQAHHPHKNQKCLNRSYPALQLPGMNEPIHVSCTSANSSMETHAALATQSGHFHLLPLLRLLMDTSSWQRDMEGKLFVLPPGLGCTCRERSLLHPETLRVDQVDVTAKAGSVSTPSLPRHRVPSERSSSLISSPGRFDLFTKKPLFTLRERIPAWPIGFKLILRVAIEGQTCPTCWT